MTVATFVQPNVTTQSAAVYKAAIDAAIAVLATIGADYACHAKGTPDMQVLVDSGQLFLANSTLVSNAQQTSATIVAPVTNPRIDRIVINDQTGVISVITGSEAASPSAPAITAGTRPVAQILLATSTTAITNSMITDERVVTTFDVSTFIRTLLDDANAAAARATLGAVGLTGDETIAGEKTFSGSLLSTKAAASGYSRVSPNLCRVDVVPTVSVLTRDTVTLVTGPTGCKGLVLLFVAQAGANNAIGARNIQVDVYSDSGGTTQISKTGCAGYEPSAITAGLAVASVTVELHVKTDSSGRVWLKMSDDGGNQGIATYAIVGYYD